MGDHLDVVLKRPSEGSCRSQKSGENIKTAGRWPRKLEPFKKCVTTYQPNVFALKMDGAQTFRLYITHIPNATDCGVGMCEGAVEGYPVKGAGGAFSTDLGCSSD